ncbi:hypothetical protein NL676_007030 [Syzygium grande]|nr:hypothetical protein NL676_007030 [Syzygium grande]
MNKTGTFNDSLNKDVKGLLGLYEASFHGLEGETILDEARNFASKHLKDLNIDEIPAILASHVSHALDMPIHWRPNGLEARWFMDMWDITDIDKLPPTIRDSFTALYNTTNEIGYWTMRELGINTIPYMRKVWADECKAHIKEVNWYNKGIKPTLKEYMEDAVDSIGGLIMLLGSYFLTTDKLTEEGLDYYELAQGDNFKALECYMNETSASEEATREHVRHLVHETWKRINNDVFEDYPFPGFGPFLGACLNLARASQCFYKYGDGHGLPDNETKDHIVTALFDPVPID